MTRNVGIEPFDRYLSLNLTDMFEFRQTVQMAALRSTCERSSTRAIGSRDGSVPPTVEKRDERTSLDGDVAAQLLISGFSCRTTFNKERWTSIWPL